MINNTPIKFKIAVGDVAKGKLSSFDEVDGYEAFWLYGYKFVAHKEENEGEGSGGDFESWEITELQSGMRIPLRYACFNIDQAIIAGVQFLSERGEESVRTTIEKAIEKVNGKVS